MLDFELSFDNEPPVIASVTVTPEVLLPEAEAQVIVEAHDPDDGELSYDYGATEGFEVVADEENPSQARLIAPDAFDVEAKLTVTVTDAAGAQAQETVNISTRGHADPIIESVSAIPDVLEPGGVATLEVVASSPNDDELTYQWDAPESWTVAPTDEATAEVTAPNFVDEFATIVVVVEDEFGGRAESTVELRTSAGNVPEITALTVDPPQTVPGGEMALFVEAHDPDGTDLSYQWSAPSEWTIVDGGQPDSQLIAPDEYGALAHVMIEVTDEYGLSASATIIVSTIENQGPQIQTLTAVPGEVARGGLIDLDVVATHPQNAELSYDWTMPAEWTLIEDPANPESPQLEAPYEPGVTDLVEVVITDPTGLEAVASVMVRTLENQAPVIESLDASPAAAVPGQEQTIQASVYDPDGETLTIEWTVPDEWEGTSDTDELVLTAPDQYDVSGTVTLSVFDGYDTRTATVSVSTVQNLDPTISSFSASPAIVDRGATSELVISASHPYDEELSFAWELDNVDWSFSSGAGTADDTATIEAPDISESVATVTVTITDDHGGESTTSVVVQTAPNSSPVISSLSADPQIVSRLGSSTITIDAHDPDGEDLAYTWSVDNSAWSFTAGAGIDDDTATLEAPDVPGSEVVVTVSVDDGYGASASSSVALLTTPSASPVIVDVTLDPEEWVEQQGTADITGNAFHPDGDPLYYDWSVTGAWTIDGSVGADEEAEVTAPGINNDSATVEVTVTDDWGGSDTYSFSVRTQDTEVDAFSFTDAENVGPFHMITSDAVEVTGFDGPVSAECTDCEVSVNGGAFAATVSDVHPGDTIEIQRESGDLEETVSAFVTVGDTPSSLWSITTTDWEGIREFTNCGQQGYTGPSQSQCDDAYAGMNLESAVVLDSGIQIWTAPTTGTYRIEAWGAEGGSGYGGQGARMAGDFNLSAGDELKIVVGQRGTNIGGGGGSFVVTSSDAPLLIAGGGGAGVGGTWALADGTTTEDAESGSLSSSAIGNGGTNGGAGGADNCSGSGGAGGLLGSATGSDGGSSFVDGALGGNHSTSPGGFGSAGANRGGGGGYSGGGSGGCGSGARVGGGGGSFNGGINQDNEAGVHTGHGQVTIDLVTD